MAAEHTTTEWDQLPLALQQCILVLTGSPCARRVSKAWRDAFDTTSDKLFLRLASEQSLKAATAAATRVVKNSASLTAVNVVEQEYGCDMPHPLMLSDLLAAGATSGLATRLRVLTGITVTAACAVQQLQALRQCTGLTHLDISGSDLQDCPAAELTAALQAMPRLTRLHVCSCKLQSQLIVAALASGLQPLAQLQHLHLAGSYLGKAGLAALTPALSAMPRLQTLDVVANLLSGAAGARALCTLLGALPGLTHLDASYNILQDEGAAMLAAVLWGMTQLQILKISYTSIGDVGMALLAPALAALPHLHVLDLSYNQLGTSAASVLQPVLARDLSELDLSWNQFNVEDAHALALGLGTATQLRGLSLRNTSLGSAGWVALAPSLSRLGPSLQSLLLGPDSLDDAASAALAAALQALTGLTRLWAMQFFTSAAMVTISPALMGMQRLQALYLSNSVMSAEGTAAFAAVLPALAGSLTHLDLSKCSMDAVTAAGVLAPALARATGLSELCLGDNAFGPQGAQWLVPVLSGLPHLRKVDLYACKLGVPGCMAIARALKDRDGASLNLRSNGLGMGSAEGDELCNMPGISICLQP